MPAARGDSFSPGCPTRRLLDRIGTKWVSMVVKLLAEAAPGELRFSELHRCMPGVSQKMLPHTLQGPWLPMAWGRGACSTQCRRASTTR
nr:helix-turn-helix domain-containing protein [Candidatus Frankia alpina]